jgi:hypothetical protein
MLENAVRLLVARMAVERGGFALHAAGVLRDGKAWLFAGPSGAGKTTAVRLSAPAPSLGDDYGVVLRRGSEWFAAAVPFDNSERVSASATEGLFPLAGVWRLHRAATPRIEPQRGATGSASLLACVAFHRALPDLAERVLSHVEALVRADRYHHLYFAPDPGFWSCVAGQSGGQATNP